MWTHFLHLILQSLVYMPTIISGNWISIFFPLTIYLAGEAIRVRKCGWRAITWQNVKRDTLLMLGAYGILFAWAVINGVYADHQYLVDRNHELSGKGLANPYAIKQNEFYSSLVNTFMAFEELKGQPGLQKGSCDVKITAPEENQEVAKILATIARYAHCFVEPTDPLVTDPTDTVPTPANVVVVHANQGPKGAAFALNLSNAFNVKLNKDLPPSSTFIWVQVGKGAVWSTGR